MREILFRGKRKNNGEWVEGFLIGRYDPFIRENVLKFAFIDNGTILYNAQEIMTETVGQYTGLTDKNGKKIFEGDIVVSADYKNIVRTVIYTDGGFKLLRNGGRYPTAIGKLKKHLIVVGNIHDNIELLKEKE